MPRARSKGRAAAKFAKQFVVAAVVVTGLWFAGVGFSRSALSRPLGGDSGPNGRQFSVTRNLRIPEGFKPQPGKTYILGKNGVAHLVNFHGGDSAIDWQAWTGALHIVLLVGIIAFVLAMIDRGLRGSRRRLSD